MASKTQRKIVKEISHDTNIRESVVGEVLARYQDIVVEEIVNTGEFSSSQIFKVGFLVRPPYSTPLGKSPKKRTLKIRLQRRINHLYRYQQDVLKSSGEKIINKDNWKHFLESEKTFRENAKASSNSRDSSDNPLLADGDEEE